MPNFTQIRCDVFSSSPLAKSNDHTEPSQSKYLAKFKPISSFWIKWLKINVNVLAGLEFDQRGLSYVESLISISRKWPTLIGPPRSVCVPSSSFFITTWQLWPFSLLALSSTVAPQFSSLPHCVPLHTPPRIATRRLSQWAHRQCERAPPYYASHRPSARPHLALRRRRYTRKCRWLK